MKARILWALALLFALSSCQESGDQKTAATPKPAYKDGIYSATFQTPDSRGWKAFLQVQVREGQVVSANFDYSNADGALKSQDQGYADSMKKVTGTTPAEAAAALLDALVEKQGGEVQVVTGATGTSQAFNLLAKAALEKAAAGDTAQAVLPQPAE